MSCHMSIQYGDTSEIQFGTYIYYFDSILIFFFKFQFHLLQIETKFNFHINLIMIFLLKMIVLLHIFNNIKFI